MKNQYIKVEDSRGNWNIWKITNETTVDNQELFEIHSRTTYTIIEKEFCFCEYGSSLLSYENGDRTIDINDSNIELETEREYAEWKREQKKNINPFRVFEEVDFGYLEDEVNEPLDLVYMEDGRNV